MRVLVYGISDQIEMAGNESEIARQFVQAYYRAFDGPNRAGGLTPLFKDVSTISFEGANVTVSSRFPRRPAQPAGRRFVADHFVR